MNRKIAFIFPGQGSQYVGMGKDLYDEYEIVREVYDTATKELEFDVAKMSFELEDVNQTKYTQPCMLTMSVALLKLLKEFNIKPEMAAGLSLGEYAALVCGKVFSFEDAVKLVYKRGIFMQECIPNGRWKMAAIIGLEDDVVENICSVVDGFVRCTNYNCPGQIVIAGEECAVQSACEKLNDAGARKIVYLNVSAPFHTEKLIDAKENMKLELEKNKFEASKIPVIKNIDAKEYSFEDDIGEVLSNHIISPVLWRKTVEYMLGRGINTFIELGPGKTLSGFIKKINKDVKVYNVENIDTLKKLLSDFE